MEKMTFIQKIKNFISKHKILSIIILILILGLSYFVYYKNKNKTETRYITSTVSKGSIVSTVSGTGQVEAMNTVNINAKVSGDVTYVAVKVGQEVKKGDLIASIDSRDAKIALENAQLSLDKLKTPSNLTVLQQENTLNKSYDDSWSNMASFITDMDTALDGISDLHDDYLGGQNRMLVSKMGKTKIDNSEKAYWTAKKSYDSTVILYKSLSRTSSNSDLMNLFSKAKETSSLIANAVKLSQESFDYTADNLDDTSSTDYKTSQSNLTSWTTSVNSYTKSISGYINDINENSLSLKETLAGSDELDIRQAELSLETKRNAYNDCFIRASFDGVIGSLTAKVGQTASGTIGTLITKQKAVSISLNEVDIAKIKLDQKATLTLDAVEDLTITGKVAEIDSVGTVSSGVVTYDVLISLDVDDSRIKPGMSVSAVVTTDTAQDVIVVPSSAVKTKNGVSYVETFASALSEESFGSTGALSDVLPTKTKVKIGLSDDTNVEITSGLKEGDIIVTKTITATATSSSSTKKTASAASLLGGSMGGNKSGSSVKSGSAGAPPMN